MRGKSQADCTILDIRGNLSKYSRYSKNYSKKNHCVKLLPNTQANKRNDHDAPEIVQLPIFLGNEEKEQLNKFDEMENNVQKVIDCIKQIKDSTKVDKVIQEINIVCDEIETFVAALRKNLLQQVL